MSEQGCQYHGVQGHCQACEIADLRVTIAALEADRERLKREVAAEVEGRTNNRVGFIRESQQRRVAERERGGDGMSVLTLKWVDFERDAVDYQLHYSHCRISGIERKKEEAYLTLLEWALEADAAMGEVVDDASEAYRASDGEIEIGGYTFDRLRAARLLEGDQ